jgi:hypothetical protein
VEAPPVSPPFPLLPYHRRLHTSRVRRLWAAVGRTSPPWSPGRTPLLPPRGALKPDPPLIVSLRRHRPLQKGTLAAVRWASFPHRLPPVSSVLELLPHFPHPMFVPVGRSSPESDPSPPPPMYPSSFTVSGILPVDFLQANRSSASPTSRRAVGTRRRPPEEATSDRMSPPVPPSPPPRQSTYSVSRHPLGLAWRRPWRPISV